MAGVIQLVTPDDRGMKIVDSVLRLPDGERVGLLKIVGWHSLDRRWVERWVQPYGVLLWVESGAAPKKPLWDLLRQSSGGEGVRESKGSCCTLTASSPWPQR